MNFTIVFHSNGSDGDFYLEAEFEPCFQWRWGDEILTPHRDTPWYVGGDLKHLLNNADIASRISKDTVSVSLSVDTDCEGKGTEDDLKKLKSDLHSEGFRVKLIR